MSPQSHASRNTLCLVLWTLLIIIFFQNIHAIERDVPVVNATVIDSNVVPADPKAKEPPPRSISRFPEHPGEYVPLPLPVSKADGKETARNPGRVHSYNVRTGEETFSESHDASALLSLSLPGERGVSGRADKGEVSYSSKNFSDLEHIYNQEDYPWCVNCKLFFKQDGTSYVASGILIDSKHVLTAGHCVHEGDDGEWSTDMVVVPAYENGDRPYGDAAGIQFHSWTGWTQNHNFDHDLGVIDLDRPVGALTGWVGYGYDDSPSFYTDNTFHNAGYPAESPYSGNYMYYWYGKFDYTETLLGLWVGNEVGIYKLGYAGQSGSGAYFKDGDDRYVYSVVSNRVVSTPKLNFCRITSSKFDDIHDDFIDEDLPSTFDLMPLDVQSTPYSITAGEQLDAMDYVVHNYSECSWGGEVDVNVYLSTNSTISSADTLIQSHYFEYYFTSKKSVIVNITPPPTIPADMPEGNYWLGVVLDVSDYNTNNNSSDGQDASYHSIIPSVQYDPDIDFYSYTVDDDSIGGSVGNGDGQVNPGETIELVVTLRNSGDADAHNVTASISTSDGYVTITDSYEEYGSIPVGETGTTTAYYDFSVSPGCPNGHWISFVLDITSDEGSWADTFQVPVYEEASAITISSPGPGEAWGAGTLQQIQWSPSGSASLNLQYRIKYTRSWIDIPLGGDTADDGSFGWTVPDLIGSERCQVRVQTGNGAGVSGEFTMLPLVDVDTFTYETLEELYYQRGEFRPGWSTVLSTARSQIRNGDKTYYEWFTDFITAELDKEFDDSWNGRSALGYIARLYFGTFNPIENDDPSNPELPEAESTSYRVPDWDGYRFWIGAVNVEYWHFAGGNPDGWDDNHRAKMSVVSGFFNSYEYRDLYEGISDGLFIRYMYANILGREGDILTYDSSGYYYWLNLLQSAGTPGTEANNARRKELVASFAVSYEDLMRYRRLTEIYLCYYALTPPSNTGATQAWALSNWAHWVEQRKADPKDWFIGENHPSDPGPENRWLAEPLIPLSEMVKQFMQTPEFRIHERWLDSLNPDTLALYKWLITDNDTDAKKFFTRYHTLIEAEQ